MTTTSEVRVRVTLRRPPVGVRFGVQGKTAAALASCAVSSGGDLSFDFPLRVATPLRFLGEFAHGPVTARFVYVCSGTAAGQPESCWTRRAKVPLSGLPEALVDQARATGAVIEAVIEGTGRDGGPACASVKLIEGGWRVKQ